MVLLLRLKMRKKDKCWREQHKEWRWRDVERQCRRQVIQEDNGRRERERMGGPWERGLGREERKERMLGEDSCRDESKAVGVQWRDGHRKASGMRDDGKKACKRLWNKKSIEGKREKRIIFYLWLERRVDKSRSDKTNMNKKWYMWKRKRKEQEWV